MFRLSNCYFLTHLSMADLFQPLCLYAPWMPLHMARFSILNCTRFQVNLVHFSHFYCPSAWRSTHNSLCHAAHNDVSADPLAGKWTECNRLFNVSLFAESMKVTSNERPWQCPEYRPILTGWMLHTFYTHPLLCVCVCPNTHTHTWINRS